MTPKGASPPALTLPKPGARDAVRARTRVLADRPHLLAIVACPDRTPDETAALAAESRIEQASDLVACTIGGRRILFNVGSVPARLTPLGPDANEIELPAGAVAVWLDGQRLF